jgi:hypothetical protein
MPHPYAGSAGYIYANERMAAESDPSFQVYRLQDNLPPPLPKKPRKEDIDRYTAARNHSIKHTYYHTFNLRNRLSETDLRPITKHRRDGTDTSDLRFTNESASTPRDALKRAYKSMKKRLAKMKEAMDARRREHSRGFRD